MKYDVATKSGSGQFRRLLAKENYAVAMMRRAHSGMHHDRFCNRRMFSKWNNVRKRNNERFKQPNQ